MPSNKQWFERLEQDIREAESLADGFGVDGALRESAANELASYLGLSDDELAEMSIATAAAGSNYKLAEIASRIAIAVRRRELDEDTNLSFGAVATPLNSTYELLAQAANDPHMRDGLVEQMKGDPDFRRQFMNDVGGIVNSSSPKMNYASSISAAINTVGGEEQKVTQSIAPKPD